MKWLNDNSGGVTVLLTGVLALLTGIYAWLTLHLARHARRQVDETRRAAEAQAVLAIVTFLQAPHVRVARTTVRALEPPADWRVDWSKEEIAAADVVCSSYDAAAMLVVNNLVDEEPFLTNWGPSIIHCYSVCRAYVEDRRRTSGPTYWMSFTEVAGRAQRKLGESTTAVGRG